MAVGETVGVLVAEVVELLLRTRGEFCENLRIEAGPVGGWAEVAFVESLDDGLEVIR